MTPPFNPLQLTYVRPSTTAANLKDAADRRELAHRSNNGIEVTLFWTKATNAITLEVLDSSSGNRLAFGVDRHVALDAFTHPYVYAPEAAVNDPPARIEP
jgi:hypothetical protein